MNRKENNLVFVLKNIVIAAIAFIALAWITLLVIDVYTHHGEVETVPDLRGLYIEEANAMLQTRDLYPQVIDSVYDRKLALGAIVEQTPKANSKIKRNRPVYLIINSTQIRQIPLPDVNDMSYRQADAILRSLGFVVGNIEYKPSEYKDLVVDMKYSGASIASGTRLTEGSEVSLVVGSGLSEGESITPDLKGLALNDARQQAIEYMCVIGATEFDAPPANDENEYFVYRQQPQAGTSIPSGARVDIWLTKDKSLLNRTFESNESETQEDEKFF
jgi:beta-lactam-binding protein with PASTA domain